MSVEVRHKTVDVGINTEKVTGHVITENAPAEETEKALRLYYSLMGEQKPVLAPLSTGYSFDEKMSYRYDWIVGLTPIKPDYWWAWPTYTRDDKAVIVQLLIDCGDSELSFSEMLPVLSGLQPSRRNPSFLEKYGEMIRESAKEVAELARPIPVVPDVIKVGSNFISSGEKDAKRWWIYRFLDEEKSCSVVEWNIGRQVLDEFGPLLRGSIILTFHGTPKKEVPNIPISMLLRPRLAFDKKNDPILLPYYKELEEKGPVELSIQPSMHAET